MRMHKFYSPWCSLLQHYMDRAKLGQSGFAEVVGSTQGTIHTYLVGRVKPPLEELETWSKALDLTTDEKEAFKWAAMEIYTPTVVWEKMQKLMGDSAATGDHLVGLDDEATDFVAQLTALKREVAELRTKLNGMQPIVPGASDHLR